MKFSTFVKLGGHAFNLMQNKDMVELFGVVKPGVQNQIKKIKVNPAPSGSTSAANYPAHYQAPYQYPMHYPIPIDSPHHPYGMPQARPYGYPRPPHYPRYR